MEVTFMTENLNADQNTDLFRIACRRQSMGMETMTKWLHEIIDLVPERAAVELIDSIVENGGRSGNLCWPLGDPVYTRLIERLIEVERPRIYLDMFAFDQKFGGNQETLDAAKRLRATFIPESMNDLEILNALEPSVYRVLVESSATGGSYSPDELYENMFGLNDERERYLTNEECEFFLRRIIKTDEPVQKLVAYLFHDTYLWEEQSMSESPNDALGAKIEARMNFGYTQDMVRKCLAIRGAIMDLDDEFFLSFAYAYENMVARKEEAVASSPISYGPSAVIFDEVFSPALVESPRFRAALMEVKLQR